MAVGFGGAKRTCWRDVASFAVALAVASALLLDHARAQDPLLEEATDFFGQVLQLETGAPALIVAVVRGADSRIAGFGEAVEGSGRAPDGDTLMRIGSITKAFTGHVLAGLASDGTLSLGDPLEKHLDWNIAFPQRAGRGIRLVDLATHAGGLPREVPRAPGPDDDPFSTITREAFASWLETQPLLFAPGAAVLYSNFGFDLLSSALARAAGKPYPELSGHMDAMGLGWVVMMPQGSRPLILQKAGGLQGIFSYVAFAPTRGVGVFVAIDKFDFAAAMAMAEAANNLIATLAPR